MTPAPQSAEAGGRLGALLSCPAVIRSRPLRSSAVPIRRDRGRCGPLVARRSYAVSTSNTPSPSPAVQADPRLDPSAYRPHPRRGRPLDLARDHRAHPTAPARPLVADLRRPWERPSAANRLTPSRVRRGFRDICLSNPPLPTSAPKTQPTRPGTPTRLPQPAPRHQPRHRQTPSNATRPSPNDDNTQVKNQAKMPPCQPRWTSGLISNGTARSCGCPPSTTVAVSL